MPHMQGDGDGGWAPAHASRSTKGCGGLASSAPRLPQRLAYTGPGPGSYCPPPGPASRPACGHGDGRGATFGTAPRRAAAAALAAVGAGPGATEAAPSMFACPAQRSGAAAAFKASARCSAARADALRDQLLQSHYPQGQHAPWIVVPPRDGHSGSSRPCPGPRAPVHPPTATQRWQQRHIQSASSAVCPGARPAHRSAGHGAAAGARHALASGAPAVYSHTAALASGTVRDRCSWQQPSADGPGPLQYSSLRTDTHARSSPMFVQPLVVDRFGRQRASVGSQTHVQPPSSASGAQQAAGPRATHQQAGVSAPFRSTSPGHSQAFLAAAAAADAGMLGAPGPAYYVAQPPRRKVSHWGGSASAFVTAV